MTTINDKFKPGKRVTGGIYRETPDEVAEGDQVAFNLDNTGRMRISCIPFSPVNGTGQTIAFSAVAGRSTQLTVGNKYWIWTTEICYLAFGGSSITATSSDFPFPPGAVVEYTAETDRDYISAIRYTDTGVLFIGQATS